jgi:hypothetical protein
MNEFLSVSIVTVFQKDVKSGSAFLNKLYSGESATVSGLSAKVDKYE